jgi:UTP--glucose-1-phosphate uridylyltransferase
VSRITKAVIPAAGLGTRFLPLTKAQPKEMLPVLHKPVIQYVVEEAYASGLREILIITGKGKRAIEDHFDRVDPTLRNHQTSELDEMLDDITLYFVRQRQIRGLGDAIAHAESYVEGEPFAVLLGDTLTAPPCIHELMKVHAHFGSGVIAVEEVKLEEVYRYGIVAVGEFTKGVAPIRDLVEKPDPTKAPSRLAILGRYILTPGIFDCLRTLAPGASGEIQLTDAIRECNRKEVYHAMLFAGRRYDIGTKIDWLKSNIELALEDPEFGPAITPFLKSVVRGR